MFSSYIKYIKNNPKGYWFRAKWFGWGWTPATWQGWVVIAIFIVYLILISESLPKDADIASNAMMDYFIKLIAGVLVLLAICYKTGEKPRWSWGPTKKK